MDMQHGHTAWTWSIDMYIDMDIGMDILRRQGHGMDIGMDILRRQGHGMDQEMDMDMDTQYYSPAY
jgi:hypothetical protein